MAFVSQTVMEEGKAAKQAGRSMDDNPYPAGSQNGADWLEGYTYDETDPSDDETLDDDAPTRA